MEQVSKREQGAGDRAAGLAGDSAPAPVGPVGSVEPVEPVGPLGLYVGQQASRCKVVSDADLRLYAELTGDYNPLHFDDAFAAGTRFGRRVAQGGVTAGMLNALVAMELPGPGTVFMSQQLTYRAPAFVGDTLTATVEVIGLKPDKPV